MTHRILLLIKGLGRGGAEQLLVNSAAYTDRDRFGYEAASSAQQDRPRAGAAGDGDPG